RAKLAAEARNYGLASYLAKGLATRAVEGQLLAEAAQEPQPLSQTARFAPATQAMAGAVGLGPRPPARQDPEKALGLLDLYSKRMPFSAEEKVAIAREIGLTLARRFDARALPVMAEYDPELRDNTVSEWRMRLLLRLGRWNDAYQLSRQ